jgi:hypothetical protein
MRVSNHRVRAGVTLLTAALALAGCSTTPPSAAPATVRPTAAITPDPHLTEPVTADQIFTAIRVGDLPLSVNNATSGDPTSPIVKRINADIGNWPLVISEFRTGAALREALGWDPAVPPQQGDPPYSFVAMNVLVQFGPVTGPLAAPDERRTNQAEILIGLLDPLLWPIEQRSVVPIPTKAAEASPAPSGSGAVAPSGAPPSVAGSAVPSVAPSAP